MKIDSVLLILFAITSQAFATEFPPVPGKRYDIGGYQLHLHCLGEGEPTVIIDTGLGDDSSDWATVQQQTANISRTCVYDRPGYGWSDVGPQPRNSMRIANELAKLLEVADIAPPYVLVGHSFGGYNVRVYAAQHPDAVAGIVLVDASHEQQYDRLQIKLPDQSLRGSNILILPKSTGSQHVNKSYLLRERAIHAARAEILSLRQSSIQVTQNPALPTVPLIVISRGRPEWREQADASKREKIWIELQQDLWRLSPISQHIFANRSGHDIHLQQPDVVAGAISEVVALSRVMK